MSVFSPGSSSQVTGTLSTVGPSNPTVFNTTIAAANTEQSYTVPAGTKRVLVKTHEADLKIAYSAGTSGTTYLTIPRHCFYAEGDISFAGSVYFQSAAVGMRVEIISWQT